MRLSLSLYLKGLFLGLIVVSGIFIFAQSTQALTCSWRDCEDVWVSGYTDRYCNYVPGYTDNYCNYVPYQCRGRLVYFAWINEWVWDSCYYYTPGYWESCWVSGYWESCWVSGYYKTECTTEYETCPSGNSWCSSSVECQRYNYYYTCGASGCVYNYYYSTNNSCTSLCGANETCSGGVCVSVLKSQGSSCTSDSQCQSGECTDGYCCTWACSGTCMHCDYNPGTCTYIGSGQDPDSECSGTGTCGGTCNGGGSCQYPSAGIDCGICSTCDGSGYCLGRPSDDSECGIIDCDGLDSYYQSGSDSPTGTDYCYYRNYSDLTSGRCKALGNCKDANTADCTNYSNSLQYSCGTCQYVPSNYCTGSTRGSCGNYAEGTSCGADKECDDQGNCVAVAECTGGSCCNLVTNTFKPLDSQPTGWEDVYRCLGTNGAAEASWITFFDWYCNGTDASVHIKEEIKDTCSTCEYCLNNETSCRNYAEGTSCGENKKCDDQGNCVVAAAECTGGSCCNLVTNTFKPLDSQPTGDFYEDVYRCLGTNGATETSWITFFDYYCNGTDAYAHVNDPTVDTCGTCEYCVNNETSCRYYDIGVSCEIDKVCDGSGNCVPHTSYCDSLAKSKGYEFGACGGWTCGGCCGEGYVGTQLGTTGDCAGVWVFCYGCWPETYECGEKSCGLLGIWGNCGACEICTFWGCRQDEEHCAVNVCGGDHEEKLYPKCLLDPDTGEPVLPCDPKLKCFYDPGCLGNACLWHNSCDICNGKLGYECTGSGCVNPTCELDCGADPDCDEKAVGEEFWLGEVKYKCTFDCQKQLTDNTPPVSTIIDRSPGPTNNWFRESFKIKVSDQDTDSGIKTGSCKYSVWVCDEYERNCVLRRNMRSRTCNDWTNEFITVGRSTTNLCYKEGIGTCKIQVYSENNVDMSGYSYKVHNIDFTPPTVE